MNYKDWIKRGYVHIGISAIASFLAFYIFFGVRIDLIRGFILIGFLLFGAVWFFNQGTDRLWGEEDKDER